MNSQYGKRQILEDITNKDSSIVSQHKKARTNETSHMMPILSDPVPIPIPSSMYLQNLHPGLAMFKSDLKTDKMSFEDLQHLCDFKNEPELVKFLTDLGVLAQSQICTLCGFNMRQMKQANTIFWICTRRVDGKKCNSAKFSIRKGTFFDNSKLSIQSIVRIVWNFIHHLSAEQCKSYVAISTKTNHTVTEYYADCRAICNSWIRNPKNTPKLGGFGKIVEMDESYFAGQPKYKRGRRLGTSWEDDEKWTFGLTERDSLDCVLIQVPSSRNRSTLLPIINAHCLEGTLFCSDGWRSYNKLADHLDLEDVLHYPVNHSKNYVDPETGAHTQTIEGLWGHVKDFLPTRGMKPCDLYSYLGWFMWTRFCKQRNLDKFVHFFKCVSEVRPPLCNHMISIGNIQHSINDLKEEKVSDDDFV